MSEHAPSHDNTTHTAESSANTVQTVDLLVVIQSEHVPKGLDEGYGTIAEEGYLVETADRLLAELERNGIESEDVLFSGFTSDHNKGPEMSRHEETTAQIAKLGRIANRRYARGDFIDNPMLAQRYQRKLEQHRAELKTIDQNSFSYYFNDADALYDATGGGNPLHFAATGSGATIGVYSLSALEDLAGEQLSPPCAVDATAEQIDSALLLRFKLTYVDERGQPIN